MISEAANAIIIVIILNSHGRQGWRVFTVMIWWRCLGKATFVGP